MGIDDEAEKLRQAEEWLNDGPVDDTGPASKVLRRDSAIDYIKYVLFNTRRADLREKAFYLLKKANGDEDLPR